MSPHRVLVTGGAGYIGSHTAKLLSEEGIEPIVYDNLATGHRTSVRWGPFVRGDILDTARLRQALARYEPDAIIHFAASAYVGESVENPAKYYRNNVTGTLSVLEASRAAKVDKVIFSSSCATYGVPAALPIKEATPQEPINPYGRTKLIAEQMLRDFATAYALRYVALRYFNASGADPDGELGEWHDPETHLIPRALQAAGDKIPHLAVFGEDYETADGTCVRDYVHVTDLARAHVLAFHHLLSGGKNIAVNLGTGSGTSVRDVVETIARITGREVPTKSHPRRPGDPAVLYADSDFARTVLGFAPKYSDIDTIVRTAAPFFGLEAVA